MNIEQRRELLRLIDEVGADDIRDFIDDAHNHEGAVSCLSAPTDRLTWEPDYLDDDEGNTFLSVEVEGLCVRLTPDTAREVGTAFIAWADSTMASVTLRLMAEEEARRRLLEGGG